MRSVRGKASGQTVIMNKDGRIFVAGHKGMVGSAIVRALRAAGFENILTAGRDVVDLTRQVSVDRFFEEQKPEYVFLSAAKVGGIYANDTYPADFIRDNLQIQTNVIDAAYRNGTDKLLFLGSSCIYPRDTEQPISESALLTGPLEITNEWYAIAKIAGIKMCQAYRKQYDFDAISLMPTNLYGVGDNYHLENSHVIPALIRKFHDAKIGRKEAVEVWGTGKVMREFLDVDDLADSAVYLMSNYSGDEIVNVGTGEDISISELAELVKDITGYEGDIEYDASKPEGTPRKLLDVSKLHSLGWKHTMTPRLGIDKAYRWFLDNQDSYRSV